MKPGALHFRFVSQLVYKTIAVSCVLLLALVPDYPIAWSQQPQPAQPAPPAPPQTAPTEAAPKIPPEQLDSLVAPIALYPDPLLSQTLVASTYPLELVQLWQWMQKNPTLKDQALADAVQKQNWDPSIQGLVAFPDVVQRMADNIAWTTDLGNAFLAQQSDVMDAVQRMRSKAQANGALKTTPQQNVETQTVEGGKQVIVIQQSQPDVVYVPSYDPVVVYGAPAYPYPAYAYPGYVPGMMLSFGVGMAMGAAWGGGWGYGCGWGGNDVDVNFNNSFNNRDRERNANRGDRGQGGKWQHRPEHRGGAPYGDRRTADKFGGRTSGQRPTAGQRSSGGAGARQRPSGASGAGQRPGGGLSASQRPSGGAGARQRPSGGSSNRVGNRNVSSGSRGSGYGSSNNTFGGGGYDGRSARSSSSRGNSSMGSGGGSRGSGYSGGSRGGGGRGGGGRGGGGRGGGGRRR